MEGTLEDPLVKDPVADSLDTDILIPNGVNGLLEDHADDAGESSGASERGGDDEEEEKNRDEEDDEEEEEEEEEEVEDDDEREMRDDEEANLDDEEIDKEQADPSELQEIPEDEECDVRLGESKVSESLDGVSEENIVSAVSPKSHEDVEMGDVDDENEDEEEEEEGEGEGEEEDEDEEINANRRDYENEAVNRPMEVDIHTDNSDVECLDESVTEMHTDENEVHVADEKNDTKNISISSTDSDVQQINDSGENVEDSKMDTSGESKMCGENGSSLGSPDIEIMDNTKSNGHNSSTQEQRNSKETPKTKKPRKQIDLSSITPRRSSRNIKRTSYIEKEPEEVEDCSSDIEEIKPEDPLACIVDSSKDKENSKLKSPSKSSKTTIVVSDTKRLVEIAAGSKSSKGGKKEPTLVIIDTNSILSGRGGVPVSSSGGGSSATVYNPYGNKSASASSSSSHHHHHHHHQQPHHHHQQQPHHHHHHQQQQQQQHGVTSSSAFSVMPVGHSQAMYGNMRTTITPVPMTSRSSHQTPKVPMPQASLPQQQQQILPTLTDDMFVVEAPSFIVPYVYEKPPVKPLKDFVAKLGKSLAECEKEEEEERKRKKKLREEAKKREAEAAVKDDDEIVKSDEVNKQRSDDEDESDDESIIVKSKDDNTDTDTVDLTDKANNDDKPDDKARVSTYFDLPLGKFFMQIGVNLVQEFVQTDLLRTQKRKQGKHGTASAETQIAINSLIKNLEFSKENNEPFHLEMKKCEFCSFKTESALAMQHHLETPHMRNYAYKCNFCPLEVRSPHDILFHMEAEHNTRGRLERGPAFHQCPNCPFEDNQKGKLTRHILACAKKFRPERNLEPATDWEPPAKIPRLHRPRQVAPVNASALAMAMNAKGTQPLLPKLLPAPLMGRGRGRPPMQPRYSDVKSLRPGSGTTIRQDNVAGMMYRPTSSGLLVPTSYQFGSNQIFQVVGGSGTVPSGVTGVSSGSFGGSSRPTPIALVSNINDSQSRLSSASSQNVPSSKNPAAKLLSQPSISITPLPRTPSQTPISGSGSSTKPSGKNTFVICEICDGYIKDLEQLRNHMQWIHKVKIHPKMIYNRPPLNCQKCQFRFFTDQGLERHLLGSHGLVTSSMQEAANKGKDAGRCPACGRVYQWKLLNHVARDHGMTLKPAHLSYKCTVCTATFGMYKQFENHVYSAHSVVAKKVMDKKNNAPSSPSSRSNDSLLKPLKINDEITIIPQPAKPTTRGSQGRGK